MQITILGGTGMIGQALKQHLSSQHTVELYGRQVFSQPEKLLEAIKDAEIIIQLAGANIGARWNPVYKQEIWDSRIDTTRMLAQALQETANPPRVFCASAIGFYPQAEACEHHYTEKDVQPGEDFLAQLSVAWEEEAKKLVAPELLTITRFGVVLSPKGGALAKMLPAFKFGLGGPVAGGRQCFSWIDIDDLCRAYAWLIQQPQMHGTFNLTAPHPLAQKAFAETLGEVLHRPTILPLPLWQLKLMFGEGAQVLTHSASVYPQRLLDEGFEFKYPDAKSSLKHLLT
ncbi:TIGR01777 family oxidoreductase [Thiomicrorhabdus xiamenensis]|uniref:TIGR01777 family protein n=1 Tax=Thiomicrorhabdus xiamenensis TaxID=2739063 RepID=A0A7D4NZX4_9GAMM|nr:TIGR01777 family oxidoreductase [Thiomicrorhabdus xiamenensis]QKI89958.1 TIGR01777 family protein [Thiomicrorhabdus xiamenensis]